MASSPAIGMVCRSSASLVYNAIGAVAWVTTWALVGELAGSHVGAIYDGIARYVWLALGVVVLAALALIVIRPSFATEPNIVDAEAAPE